MDTATSAEHVDYPSSYYTDLDLDDIRAALRPKETFLEGKVIEQSIDLALRAFEEYRTGEPPTGSEILVEDDGFPHKILWVREKNSWQSKWWCEDKCANAHWASLRVRPGFEIVRIGFE